MTCGKLVPIRHPPHPLRAQFNWQFFRFSAKRVCCMQCLPLNLKPPPDVDALPHSRSQGVTKATAKQQMLKQLVCTDAPEQALRYHGFRTIAGVDEVGRGALFGPVVAAAVILPEKVGVLSRMGLKDSKQLDRKHREKLDRRIRKMALAFSVAEVDAETIDRVNIYQATRIAMRLAVQQPHPHPRPPHHRRHAHIDYPCPQTKLYYGDALCLSIAAASVIAKVHRDAPDARARQAVPAVRPRRHKGYATPEHRTRPQRARPLPAPPPQLRSRPRCRPRSRPRDRASSTLDDLLRRTPIPKSSSLDELVRRRPRHRTPCKLQSSRHSDSQRQNLNLR